MGRNGNMIFEERLRLAAIEADAIRMNSLSDNQVNWEFSPRFQRKMKRLIKKWAVRYSLLYIGLLP